MTAEPLPGMPEPRQETQCPICGSDWYCGTDDQGRDWVHVYTDADFETAERAVEDVGPL